MTISTDLFSGLNGYSDGATVGYSREVAVGVSGGVNQYTLGAGQQVINIHLVGVWDGASVSLEKLMQGVWYKVGVVWNTSRILEGLLLEEDSAVRLSIDTVGTETDLKVFIGHDFGLVN